MILAFRLPVRHSGRRKPWLRWLDLLSDNRKSKTRPKRSRSIQNRKWAGLFALFLALTLSEAMAEAQQPEKIPRIGFLSMGSKAGSANAVGVLRQSLRELGYVEGKDILIEYRYAEGQPERLPSLVEQLTRANIDILIASTATVARAAKKSHDTIPIDVANIGNLKGLNGYTGPARWQRHGTHSYIHRVACKTARAAEGSCP